MKKTYKLVIIPSRDCIAVYKGAWWGPWFGRFWLKSGETVESLKAMYESFGHTVIVYGL